MGLGGTIMSYVEKNLIPGECALYRTGLHWVVLIVPVFLALCLAAGGLALVLGSVGEKREAARVMAIAGAILLASGLLSVSLGILRRKATEIAVTNKRILIKTGITSRRTIELLLSKVESIVVNESLWGRMFGYGTVVVRGTGGTPEPFDRIAHPLEFRRQVEGQIEASQSQGSRPTAASDRQ
jgi:uncharacterized membrane protein YdbT with pleckstrin-like domain